jgi:hypothetical protein
MKHSWIFAGATLVVGALGGFISGRNSAGAADQELVENTGRKTRASERSEATVAEAAKRSSRPSGLAEISRMPGNSSRIQALMDFYSGLTPDQYEDEARKLESLPMNERVMASFLLFGRWAESDPTAAMAFSGTIGFAGMFVRPTILQSWSSVDPANAAKYYSENPGEFAMMGMMGRGRGPMGGQTGASIIASEWARQDVAGALAWANSLTTEKGQALNSILGEVAKTDPKKAAEMLVSMSGIDKTDGYRSVALQYGASNFSEAQAWICTLPADDQAGALAAAISGFSNIDPAGAAKQVALMEPGDAKNGVIPEVIRDWARVDSQAAADFLKAQDDERAQREGMRELMPNWVGRDPGAALSYANSYEPGPVRDSALQSWVWSNSKAKPEERIKVAESITDQGDRNRSVSVAVAGWMREDPEGARAYIGQSTALSEEAKNRILEGRGMWGGRGRGGN